MRVVAQIPVNDLYLTSLVNRGYVVTVANGLATVELKDATDQPNKASLGTHREDKNYDFPPEVRDGNIFIEATERFDSNRKKVYLVAGLDGQPLAASWVPTGNLGKSIQAYFLSEELAIVEWNGPDFIVINSVTLLFDENMVRLKVRQIWYQSSTNSASPVPPEFASVYRVVQAKASGNIKGVCYAEGSVLNP